MESLPSFAAFVAYPRFAFEGCRFGRSLGIQPLVQMLTCADITCGTAACLLVPALLEGILSRVDATSPPFIVPLPLADE